MSRFELAQRVKDLPPYLFARIDAMKREAVERGVDVIDLSIGDPDTPTPGHIVEAMKRAVEKPERHRYPSSDGMPAFREAVAAWYGRRFNVGLDAKGEVITLIGSKEGIGHLPLAFIDPGDVVLVPSPGYPVYAIGTLFAGGESVEMPLLEKNGYLPDLEGIGGDVLGRAKLMFINYPNNPTAATATLEFFGRVAAFAREHGIIVCHDAAYTETYYEGAKPPSFLEAEGAMDVGIEIHSLSKTYNMTGWRIGCAVGNREVVAGLAKIKSNLDSGAFDAVQEAGIAALETDDSVLAPLREMYRERRDALLEGLGEAGISAARPSGTFYVWAKVPEGFDSAAFSARLLKEAGVLTTPGNGFGAPGEGYVRFALTVPAERIREAAGRIRKAL
ncbi:MAG: LL-diaminopimelate aminotransferase [Nitrospirota bacterium]|jgi:LL-diaminopimelate aminotransferase